MSCPKCGAPGVESARVCPTCRARSGDLALSGITFDGAREGHSERSPSWVAAGTGIVSLLATALLLLWQLEQASSEPVASLHPRQPVRLVVGEPSPTTPPVDHPGHDPARGVAGVASLDEPAEGRFAMHAAAFGEALRTRHAAALRRCEAEAQKRGARSPGQLALVVRFDADGGVSSARLLEGADDPRLGECLRDRLRALPPVWPPGTPVGLRVPFSW